MNKILLPIALVFFALTVSGQTKNNVLSKVISNAEFVNVSQKSLAATNTVAWTDDFSVSTNWLASNQTGDNQNWVVNAVGPVGTYSSSIGSISSASSSNGFALFDSDYLGSSGGVQNASIQNAQPIDLSSYTALTLTFHQRYRKYQSDLTYVGVSTDGVVWTDVQVNSLVAQGAMVDNTVSVNIAAYANNQAQVWIRFHFVGAWDYVWMVDDVTIEGLTLNTPEILTVDPGQGFQGESLSVALSGQYTNFAQGSTTICFQQATSTTTVAQAAQSANWFQQATSTIFCGYNVNVIDAFNFTFDLDVPAVAPPGMYDAKVTNPVDGVVMKPSAFEVFMVNLPASWNYTTTLGQHTILIPDYALLTIDGAAISLGDYLGVFYDNGTDMVCGGYVQWNGSTAQLLAWADDGGTPVTDGFTIGDEFEWKVFDISANQEYDAVATYQTAGFPNTATFDVNGLSGVSAIAAMSLETQTLNIPSGWSIFSTYIVPVDPDIEAVMSPVYNDIVIVKGGDGNVYWPPFVDLIGDIEIGKGYQVNLSTANMLDVVGSAVEPQSTPFTIPSGWSIMAYLRQSPANIAVMMGSVESQINIIKNGLGEVYWPIWGVNGIGDMIPGEGYQINAINQIVYSYPANGASSKNLAYTASYKPSLYYTNLNTGINMTLAIPQNAFDMEVTLGDELGVFNQDGLLVGAAVYTNANLAITIWGDNEFTSTKDGMMANESYSIKLYDHESGTEQFLAIDRFIQGSDKFSENGIAVVGKLSGVNSFQVEAAYPNPATTYTNFSFTLAEETPLAMSVYDNTGRLIKVKKALYAKGDHVLKLDVSSYASGMYYCELSTLTFKQTIAFDVQ